MYARQLLDEATSQAAHALPPIEATARLHIARVLTAYSIDEARSVFIAAARAVETLGLNHHDLDAVRHEAHMLAAAIAPDLIADLPPLSDRMLLHSDGQLFRTMIDHGHMDAALELLLNFDRAGDFPHRAVPVVLAGCPDTGKKVALLQRAVRAWRDSLTTQPVRYSPPHSQSLHFLNTFVWNWKLLPVGEASSVVQDLVATIVSAEDFPMQARFDPEERVSFTSMRQHQLFELLECLRQVAPALADSLMDDHTELAAAAAFFPLGMQSVREAWAKRSTGQCNPGGGTFGIAGSPQDMPFALAMVKSRTTGQFTSAFEEVLKTWHKDKKYNEAMKECWPSTQAFRSLLYTAGEALGSDAAAYLEQMPDSDLKLYGQIELAAALAGLPAYSGIGISSSRQVDARPLPRQSG